MTLWSKFAAVIVVACFTTVYAQPAVCTDLVRQALATVETACAQTGRNQACYGNVALTATPRDGVRSLTFRQQGDVADVADLASLQLQQLDAEQQVWGIVMMKLQANLPDTLPGQNVTFLLFGDVKITNAVTSAPSEVPLRPMQAFYFSTGISKSNCAEAPDSGILIQTPKGAGKINLRANDVDIQLGSTAYLRAQPAGKMTVSVVEGEGILTSDGKTVIVPAGAQAQVPIDEDLQADGVPDDPEPYEESEVADLPVDLMPEDIEIASPEEFDAEEDDVDADSLDDSEDFSDEDVADNVDDSLDESFSGEDMTEFEDASPDESYDESGDDASGSQDEGDSGSSDGGGDE